MSKCIRCGVNEAILPDRNTMSRRKKICLECHRKDLKQDVIMIINTLNKRDTS